MAVDPRFAGREYPPTDVYEVAREKIRDFADAVGAAHPAHRDVGVARSLGHADVVAPPTFAVIVAQRADARLIEDPSAGIDFTRVVHADQRFTHHRPIVAGDQLVAELHVDQVRAMGGGAMITTRAEISTIDGERTATTRSSLLVRGEDQ